jgi:hypothetical protein
VPPSNLFSGPIGSRALGLRARLPVFLWCRRLRSERPQAKKPADRAAATMRLPGPADLRRRAAYN